MRHRPLAPLVALAAAGSCGSPLPYPTAPSPAGAPNDPALVGGWPGVQVRDEFQDPDGTGRAGPPTHMQVAALGEGIGVRLDCAAASPGDAVDVVVDSAGDGRRRWRYTLRADGACAEQAADDGGELPPAACDSRVRHASSMGEGRWLSVLTLPFARIGAAPEWTFRVTRSLSGEGRPRRLVWAPADAVLSLPPGGPVSRLRAGPRALDWHVSQARIAVSGDTQGRTAYWVSARVTNLISTPIHVALHAALGTDAAHGATADMELSPGASGDVALPSFVSSANPFHGEVDLSSHAPAARSETSLTRAGLSKAQHVRLRVLEPAYRGNVYASQEVSDLAFRASLSPATASLAAHVDVLLLDTSGQPVRAVRAIASAELHEHLDIRALAEGNYTLVARALRTDGATLGEDRAPVRKLGKPRGSEVRVDAHGNIVVNGIPRLFIGWYGDVPTADPRPDVLALQNVRSALILSRADPRPIRESFARGVYSIVSVDPFRLAEIQGPGPERAAVADEVGRMGEPSRATLDRLAKLVDAVRDEPGLLGYYLADEPEIAGYRSDYLERAYEHLARLDPYHPVVITNMSADGIATHGARAADILNPDPYSARPDEIPRLLRTARAQGHPGQALMTTLWHASWRRHFEQDDRGPYPFALTRAQYLSAVALGARGFTGYITPFFMPEPTLRYGLPAIWRELRFLEPAIVAPAPEAPLAVEGASPVERARATPEGAGAPIFGWIRATGGHTYVIASNPSDEPLVASLRHPLLDRVRELRVVAEDRTVRVEQGAMRDAFAGGGVHVYTTNEAARAVASVGTTEADIAARQRASIAPGNLLHESTGTRVYSVRGFGPAFPRYFEYVVNGIRDDEGWHGPSIGAVKPWFEVVLPAPRSVGHVAVHTPNLRDFDLEIVDAGGTRHVAAIRGNGASEVQVPVRPALAMVKLRLTAIACREGAAPSGPMVREIEAFRAAAPKGPAVAWAIAPSEGRAPPPLPPRSPVQTVWTERFAPGGLRDALASRWTFDPKNLSVAQGARGGIVASSTAAVGYAAMTRRVDRDPRARYLQVRVGGVEGEGYRFFSIGVRAAAASRMALTIDRAGLFTLDLHALGPAFAGESARELAVSLHFAGSRPLQGGPVRPGPRVAFDWLRLTGDPVDALLVSSPDGSPVPERLRPGDAILFRIRLSNPANDAVVEWRANPGFSSLFLDGSPYVQLARAGNGDGREWAARVTLGPRTDRFDGTAAFPIVARALMSGGTVPETSTAVATRFE